MKKEEAITPGSQSNHLIKLIPLWARIVFFAILGLIVCILLVWGGFHIAKLVILKEFYSSTTNVCAIPGLNDGAVQQGITLDNYGHFICSEYMSDNHSPTRIYVSDNTGDVFYTELYEDKEFKTPCIRKCGGIQFVTSLNRFYVSDSNGFIFALPYSEIMNKNTKKYCIKSLFEPVHVFVNATSCFADSDYFYVSEYHEDNSSSVCSHDITYQNVTHHALCFCYPIDKKNNTINFTTPNSIFSLPDGIRSFTIDNNNIYVTSSFGLSLSHIYTYAINKIVPVSNYIKGVKTYFLSTFEKDLVSPPMLLDADIDSSGRIITYTSISSNKYVIGKLFFANSIYAIKVK